MSFIELSKIEDIASCEVVRDIYKLINHCVRNKPEIVRPQDHENWVIRAVLIVDAICEGTPAVINHFIKVHNLPIGEILMSNNLFIQCLIAKGRLSTLKEIMDLHPGHITEEVLVGSEFGITMAVKENHLEMIKFLLDNTTRDMIPYILEVANVCNNKDVMDLIKSRVTKQSIVPLYNSASILSTVNSNYATTYILAFLAMIKLVMEHKIKSTL